MLPLLLGCCRCGWAAAVPATKAPFGIKEARKLLEDAGAGQAWPAFENESWLLALAFSEQRGFPSPLGAASSSGKVVSTSPYVLLFDDFLSPAECALLRALAGPRLSPALVVQSGENWYDKQLQTRNNEQHWFSPKEERAVPLLRHIIKRMHRTARVPDEYAEALQVGRYNVSTKYEEHLDTDPVHRVARPATLITYLSDVEGGGETLFPVGRSDCTATWHTDPATGNRSYGAAACCASPEKDAAETVRVAPKMGRAVLFFSHFPDGNIDSRARHIGCPVTEGVKWIAQRWFRFEPYNRVNYALGAGWDGRFDGARPEGATAAQRHLRTLSGIQPQAFLEEGFLTGEEAAQLEALAVERLAGGDEVWLTAEEVAANQTLAELANRARELARLPPAAAPALRLRRLGAGGSELPHLDSPPAAEAQLAAARAGGEAAAQEAAQAGNETPQAEAQIATVAAYLSAPEEGGELAFPRASAPWSRVAAADAAACSELQDVAACCATAGLLKVRPQRGAAVLHYPYGQDKELDQKSEHVTCPVLRGELLVAEWPFVYPGPWLEPAAQAKQDAATAGGEQLLAEFENSRSAATKLFWVPPGGGDEVFMDELPAGPYTKKNLNTFPGHVFHARDEVGALLQKVVISSDEKRQRHIIGDHGEL